MKIINEKYGVIEFNNEIYHQLVNNASQQLIFNQTRSFSLDFFDNILIDNKIKEKLLFNKISIDFKSCLSWIQSFDIYFTNSILLEQIIGSEAISTSIPSILDNDFYKEVNEGFIEKGSIFLSINEKINKAIFEEYYLKIIYHEIGHLFDRVHKAEGNGRDEIYYFQNIDFNLPEDDCIVENLQIEEIHNIIKYALYYTNISERHAFIETANFEMQTTILNHPNRILDKLKRNNLEINNDNIFKHSSIIVNDYAFLYNKVNELKKLSFEKQQAYLLKYKKDLDEIFQKSVSYDWLINYLFQYINHCYLNCQKLFLYYFNLEPFNVKINQWKNRNSLIEKKLFSYQKSKRHINLNF